MVGWLGSLELAAHQIAITISTISFTIYLGLGAAVAIRTSYYKGANDWYMVRKITIAGLHLGLIVVCIVCTSLFMTQSGLGLIFTDNLHVNAIVKTLLPILMLYQIGDSAQIILANSLRGLADVKAIMWISFLAYFIIAIPAGYLLGFTFHWGYRRDLDGLPIRLLMLRMPAGIPGENAGKIASRLIRSSLTIDPGETNNRPDQGQHTSQP